jgi:HRAS-like suppressor 3
MKHAFINSQYYPIGSIIRRRLDGIAGLYGWHWGIYVGNGEVVHFNGFTKKERGAIIRRDSLTKFAAGHGIQLHHRPSDSKRGKAIADFACRLQGLSENGFNGSYAFLSKNCQDFCAYCYVQALA